MASLIERVWQVPSRRKMLALEALFRLAGAWTLVRLVPFKLWRRRLGVNVQLDMAASAVTPETVALLCDVAWVHRWSKSLSRGQLTCLMLALSAQEMLASRGVECRLVLGVRRDARDDIAGSLGAHAWVKSGELCIVGGEESGPFVPVAAYSAIPRTGSFAR